jgi:hypothetical protein
VAYKLKIMKKYIIIPFLFMAVNLFSQPINQQQNTQDQRQLQNNNQQQMQQNNNQQQMQQQNNQQQLDQYQPPQQRPTYNYTTPNNNMDYNGRKASKYRKMKVNGIVLASVGGAFLIGGVALLSDGMSKQVPVNNYNNGYNNGPFNGAGSGNGAFIETFGGTVFTIIGALATTGGVLMAVIGSKKEKDMAMANRNRVSVIIAPTAFRIAYKF